MTHDTPNQKGIRRLGCEEWQELLVDALDGTLSSTDSAAFTLHARDCAACAQLLEETRRGGEWLGYLHHAPVAPGDLVEKILARTTGTAPRLPVLTTGVASVEGQPWLGRSVAVLQRHGVESRLLMTLAMAFFSIAFTLNLTGVHLKQLRLSDLSPSALASSVSRQYYSTSAQVVRYYENLRFVYEVESRVNEFRRDSSATGSSAPAQKPASTPSAGPSGSGNGAGSAGKPSGSSQNAPPRGATGSGAASGISSGDPAGASKPSPRPRSAYPVSLPPAEPVLAGWSIPGSTPSASAARPESQARAYVAYPPSTVTTAAPRLSERPAVMSRIHDRTERSLA